MQPGSVEFFHGIRFFFSLLASGEMTANIDLAPIYNCWSRQATKEENLKKSEALLFQNWPGYCGYTLSQDTLSEGRKGFLQTRSPLSTLATRVMLKICLRFLGAVEMKWQP